jgi:hypothetical protein
LEPQHEAQSSQQSPDWQHAAPAHWLQEEQTFSFCGELAEVEIEAVAVSARARTQNSTCNLDFISIPQNSVRAECNSANRTAPR